MRMLAFLVLVLSGALAGWAIGQDEALATRLVLTAVGALVRAAIGGALLKIGRGQVSRSLTGKPIPGSGVTSEDLTANYWRDKGHPPFMKPSEADPDKRMFDPEKLG